MGDVDENFRIWPGGNDAPVGKAGVWKLGVALVLVDPVWVSVVIGNALVDNPRFAEVAMHKPMLKEFGVRRVEHVT